VSVFRCNILISGKIIKEMPGSVVSGTPYIMAFGLLYYLCVSLCVLTTLEQKEGSGYV